MRAWRDPSWYVSRVLIVGRLIVQAFADLYGRARLSRVGAMRLFDGRPAAAKPPVPADLWFMYATIRARRPRVVLEFGSGCSTYIYAQALADNAAEGHPGYLYSLDADPHWGQVTIDAMPEHLRAHCEVRICEAVASEHEGTPVWRYADIPDVVPDFIYLDGPALDRVRRASVDVLDLEPRLAPGCTVLVDGRMFNCAYLEKHFTRSWSRRRDIVLRNTVYELAD